MTLQKYTPAEKELLGKGPYYLAVSAFQKAVRRGDINRAVNFAKICWRLEPYRMFSRMWTILYEECGRDAPALLAFFKYRAGFGKFEPLIPLIVVMCRAQKSRDPVHLSYIINGTHVIPQVLHEALENDPINSRVISLYESWPKWGYASYDQWSYGVGDANYDWTVELAERAKAFEWAGFNVGSPFFFMTDTLEVRSGYDEVSDIGPLWDGWYPIVAIDDHTRPGKIAFGTFLKHKKAPFGESSKEMGWYVFYQEGWRHRNHIRYKFDFETLGSSMYPAPDGGTCEKFISPAATEAYRNTVLPELVSIRVWVLNTLFADDMLILKVEYAKDWFSVEENIASYL